MTEWIRLPIDELISSSVPGEWGTESTPELGTSVLRSTNFRNDGSIDYSDIAYRKIEEARFNRRRVRRGTILIEKSGGSATQAAGRVVFCDREFDGTASNFIQILEVSDSFDSRYVAYLLQHLYHSGLVLKYQQQTTGIINFKLNEYVDEIVVVPIDKAEQRKIAEILRTTDDALKATAALLSKQERIFAGLMHDLLTLGIDAQGKRRSKITHKFKDSTCGAIPTEWEIAETEEVCSLITKGTTPKITSTESEVYSIPYLRVQNLTFSGELNFSDLRFIDDTTHRGELARSRVLPGDVLQNIVGPPLGKVAIVPCDYHEWNINQAIAVFRPNERVSSEFLCYWLQFPPSRTWFDINSKKTSGQQNLTLEHCQQLPIALPSREEQNKICTLLRASVACQRNSVNELHKLQLLKTALMQDLLTGRKRVTALLQPEIKREKVYAGGR